MTFISNTETEAGLRSLSLKQRILAVSMAPMHVEAGSNTVDGFIALYAVDDDAFTTEEVEQAITELEAEGLIDVTE